MIVGKTTLLFPSILVTVMLINIPERHAEIACPELVQIMAGSTKTVSCNITETEILKVYWFMGDTTSTSPILRLENKQPGGTEYGKGHYNITSSGEMIIINAEILHEAVYTTLIFLHDDTIESKTIQVHITVSPWSSCPVIDVCIPCKECSLAVNDTGRLTCSVNGSLPRIPLKWIIQTRNGISIVPHTLKVVKDAPSVTWNSSVQVSYGTSSCFQEANIQCVATDPFNLLEQSVSSVRIFTANCTADNPESDKTVPDKGMTIAIVCGAMATTAVLFLFVFANRSRKRGQKEQTLTSSLKKQYKACSLLSPSSSLKDFDDHLYVACHCEMTYANGETLEISTHRLLNSNLLDENCVLLTGGINYWESVFTKQFLLNWIEKDHSDFILLFIARREVEASMKLKDILHEETSIKGDIIAKGIRTKKCILLLHGLANIRFDGKETNQNQPEGEKNNIANLTLSELLRRSKDNGNTQVKIWITSWSTYFTNDTFLEPCAKIHVSHVDQRQFDDLIVKVITRCISSSAQSLTEEAISDEAVHYVKTESKNKCKKESYEVYSTGKSQREKPNFQVSVEKSEASEAESVTLLRGEKNKDCNSLTIQDKVHLVTEFLQTSQLYSEFQRNPISLSVIAHVVINEYSYPSTDSVQMTSPTKEEIVCTVVTYLQELYFGKNMDKKRADFDIDRSLGQLALHLINGHSNRFDTQTSVLSDCFDDFNLAIEMSLLQHPKHILESQQSGQITESSLRHYVEFSSVCFTNYFAANYLVQEELSNRETLNKYKENFAMFRFMAHLVESPIKHLLGVFTKFRNDDDVIDYLHNWVNKEGVKKVMTELQGKDVKITRLDDTEHQKAFATFCEKCCEMKIKLKSIFIDRTVNVKFMTSLELPCLDELIFYNVRINEERFYRTLEWLAQKEIVFRFLDCIVPEKFSEDICKKLRDAKNFEVKTILQPDETTNSISVLQYETGTWVKQEE